MCNDGKYLHAAELMGDFLGLYPDCLSNASNETSIEFMDVYIFNILANLGRYDQARSFVAAQNWIEVERTQQLIRDIDRAEEHGEYESEYIKIEEPITESDSSRVVNVDPSEGNSQSSDDQLTKSESTNERDSEKKTKPMNALDKLRRILSLSKMPGVICVLGILISIAVRRLLARSSKTSILQLLRKLAIL